MARFLHTGDWQLGMTRHFLDADAQARFSAARLEVIRKIAAVAREHACEFVVVAGDVFDSNQVDRRTVARACEALRAFEMPVFLLPGNHDAYDAASVYVSSAFQSACPDSVRVLSPDEPHATVGGTEIVGVPWTSRRPVRDLVAEACSHLEPASGVRVMVAHGGVDDVVYDTGDPALIGLSHAEAALSDARIHYLALGDRHSRTDVGQTGRIRYAGAPEPTSFREDDPGQVLIVDVDRETCTADAVPVAAWAFVDRGFRLDSDADLDLLTTDLDAIADKSHRIVRLSLRGGLTLTQHGRLESIIDDARHVFGSIELWARHTDVAVLPNDDDFADLDLAGFARGAVDELRATVERGGDDAGAARDALALLVRLARSAT